MAGKLSVATWNINSVRARVEHLSRFLTEYSPDVVCLQEIKCQNDQFPHAEAEALGYQYHAVNGQKAYHGVAILSRLPLDGLIRTEYCSMGDARHVSAEVRIGKTPVRLHNYYVPAGGDEPDPAINTKFDHKLKFLDEMTAEFSSATPAIPTLLMGDLNIAPLESDVWSHKKLIKVVSHTPIEVDRLAAVQNSAAWVDLVRHQHGTDAPLYSWWSYRSRDWRAANKGRRLDHIWGSADTSSWLDSIEIIDAVRGWEKTSDHAPILATFSEK
jgi:exodeoxyribonuclease-3